jgi:hypothetical protein
MAMPIPAARMSKPLDVDKRETCHGAHVYARPAHVCESRREDQMLMSGFQRPTERANAVGAQHVRVRDGNSVCARRCHCFKNWRIAGENHDARQGGGIGWNLRDPHGNDVVPSITHSLKLGPDCLIACIRADKNEA